jgi:hypothetical protein
MTVRREARLLYDSATSYPEMGTRSGVADERTLLFQSELCSVDVMIHGGPEGTSFLHGEVSRSRFGVPLAGSTARIEETGETTETDVYGQFALAGGAPTETLHLVLETEGYEIICEIPPSVTAEEV